MPTLETFAEPSVFLKLIECLLTMIAISVEQGGLARFGPVDETAQEFFGGGVLVMSITVSGLLFLVFLFGGQRHIQTTTFEIAFNSIMAILIITAGSLVIDNYVGVSNTESSHGNTAGSFCILNSFVYMADTYYAVVNWRSLGAQQTNTVQQQPRQELP